MSKPNIFVAIPRGAVFDTFFSPALMEELEALGTVRWNETGRQLTEAELCEAIGGTEILVTGWGSPWLTPAVLERADKLRLLAHNAGSVRPYMTGEAYAKGVRACCGNTVFAESVAEGVLAYALAALREIPRYSEGVKRGEWPESFATRGLLGRSVGLVGFGMIAEQVARLLQPFGCRLSVYSRHISEEALAKYGMEKAGLAEIFAGCDVVSIHSGMTPENHHLITGPLLESMRPGALLINTARGAIIDEAAMAGVLARRPDLTAALDVYETEPLCAESPLRGLPNTLLMPHMAGPTTDMRRAVTRAVLGDIRRFLAGEPLACEISGARAQTMTTITK